jgi:uroporphyrinogen-III synthase
MPTDLIVLTRREDDNLPLAARIEALGLHCLSYPCIATRIIEPAADTLIDLGAGGTITAMAFPSRGAVEGLYDQPALLAQLPLAPEPVLGAVGPATAQLLTARHHAPDIVADPATGAALARALTRRLGPGARVLIPGGDKQRPELPDGLAGAGLIPLTLQVYEHQDPAPEPLPPPPPAVVVCASPSAAQTFLGTNPDLKTCAFVAIGPTTEASLQHLGATHITRATTTTPEALTQAVLEAVTTATRT